MTALVPPSPSGARPDLERSTAPEFWAGCDRGELRFVRCRQCQVADFPPAIACRRCRSRELDWETSAGRGAIYSWTVVWRPPTPEIQVPYAPIIVDLDEGYQMISNLIGVDHDAIMVGARVEVTWVPTDDGHQLPLFTPTA